VPGRSFVELTVCSGSFFTVGRPLSGRGSRRTPDSSDIHTSITRRTVVVRKWLSWPAVLRRSHGFDSHHPLQFLARLRPHQPSSVRVNSEGRAAVAGPDAGRRWLMLAW
jgi:hypothetical protein